MVFSKDRIGSPGKLRSSFMMSKSSKNGSSLVEPSPSAFSIEPTCTNEAAQEVAPVAEIEPA